MSLLSPSWAFSGQAVDAVGDAHLAPGVHFRVLTNPLLGLPVVPIVVGRITLGRHAKAFTRRDVTWVDSQGTILSAPFTVTPDNPVTGYLPAGQTCCWASLQARATALPSVLPGRSPVVAAAPGEPERAGTPVEPVAVRARSRQVPTDGPRLQRPVPLRVEGMVATPLGDAPVAVRSRPPYHVYASHIERVVVRGSGRVTGLAWLPAAAVDKAERFRTLPLPTASGVRYAGPPDGRDQGFDRGKRGAPQRLGMHESPLAANPTACAPVGAGDEVDRLTALTVDPEKTLDRLINDTSAPQSLLTAAETVLDENGTSLGTSERFLLMDLLQGAVDPGIARWLGFLDVDEQVPDEEVVVAYVVDALFAPDWKAIRRRRLATTLPGEAVMEDGVEAVRRLAERAPELERFVDRIKEMDAGPYLFGRIVLAATAAVPLDRPAGPVMGAPISGDWLPATAPTAVRELTVGLTGLVPAAGLGSALAQPLGAQPRPRNPEDTVGRRLLLTARPEPAAGPTGGVLADRLVDERDGAWQVAQLDWFGRWSTRSARAFGRALRPRPPRPVLTLTTQPPVLATPAPTDARSGTVRIEVSVPPVAALPAGGRLLKHLELTVASGGAPVLTTHPVPTPSAPPEVMVVSVPGPALLPTQSGTVTVTAVWTDSGDVDSDVSEPKHATLHDPRAPTPVVLPPTLTYTARPDATGRARATLTWTSTAGQAAFRVFVADETTMRAKLEDVAAGIVAEGDAGQAPTAAQAQALLAALDTAADAPARGALWDGARQLLPRRWWLQLTAEPLRPPPTGPVVFHHDVPGSLVVLVLFRVVAVSAASVESDFRASPLLPRGVPNLLVPPVPALVVLPVVDAAGNLQARLTVTVPVGPTPAVRYRLRRATATTDTAFMPVVAEGAVPPRPPGQPAPQVFDVIDTGSSPSGPRPALSAWLSYTWRIEVQGPSAPGGGPPGEWSSASPPAATTTMPPGPPAAVTDLSVTREAGAVHVRFRHPEPLAGGATTGYTVDVYRQLAGRRLELLRSLPGQEPPPTGRGSDVTGSFDVVDADPDAVAGTLYRVLVTDPIGRASAASPPQEAP